MKNSVSLTGKITEEGKLLIHGKSMLLNFQKLNKNRIVTIEVSTLPEQPSEKLIGYYEHVILVGMQRGFRENGEYLLLPQIDIRMRKNFAPTLKEYYVEGKSIAEIPEIRELDKHDLLAFMDYCRIYASMNLQVHIQEPRVILNY